MIKYSPNDECPCDSGKKYKKCCRPYMEGKLSPPTLETLVRARFTAYVLQNFDFIMDTTHPESPHFRANEHRWRTELEGYRIRNFLAGLEILSAEEDKVSYQVKSFQLASQEYNYIEHATFKQHQGEWHYFDSETEDIAAEEELATATENVVDEPAVSATTSETEES